MICPSGKLMMLLKKGKQKQKCVSGHSCCLSDEGSSISGGGGGGGDLFDPDVLPTRISQLRQDLLSLINLDNELFKHLLTINDTLEELKEQRQGVDKSQLHRSITRYTY